MRWTVATSIDLTDSALPSHLPYTGLLLDISGDRIWSATLLIEVRPTGASPVAAMESLMRAQRRFKLAYPRSLVSTAIRGLDSISCRKKLRRSASRTPVSNSHIGDQDLDVLLDEDFDELPCEPRILLQLANQS